MVIYKGSDLTLKIDLDITPTMIRVFTTNSRRYIEKTDIVDNKVKILSSELQNLNSGVIGYTYFYVDGDDEKVATNYTNYYLLDKAESGIVHKDAIKIQEYLDEIIDARLGNMDVTEIATMVQENTNDIKKISSKVDEKQDELVSGTNIKTINNQSILGEGNITIEGGGGTITLDDEMSDTSENGVKNKVIKAYVDANKVTKTSQLTNDSGFLTEHQDISGKADKATTLEGYGITDAYVADGTITLGKNTITPLTEHQSLEDYATKTYSDTNLATAKAYTDELIGKIDTLLDEINGETTKINGENI